MEAPGGGLFCWGRDALGFGTGQGPVLAREPVPVAPELAFTAVSLALGYACGVAATGVTWCWGQEVLGLLGTGKGDWRPEPVGFTMARVVRQ